MIESMKSFGETIRTLRKQQGEPLRVVAAAIEIDSTLLSKIERGDRLPTEIQIRRFAAYYQIPVEELAALVIADKILAEHGSHQVTLQAINLVRERMAAY